MPKLSQHFDESEFLCKCGCGGGHGRMHPHLILGLQMLRDIIGKPIVITSAFRCPAHNAKVGGVPNSYHTQGFAADIHVEGMTPYELAGQAARVPMFLNGGIGIYPKRGFIHVDVGLKRRWMG